MYWRRLHQFTGIEVCPIHCVLLEKSEIRILRRLQCQRFELPNELLLGIAPRICKEESLIRLARLGQQLLSKKWPILGIPDLRARYIQLIKSRGFGLPAKDPRICYTRLLTAIREYYPTEILEQCGCRQNDWVARLTRSYYRVQPPIRHLLLLAFLNADLSEVFSLRAVTAAPLPDPPPPEKCINRICPFQGSETAAFERKEFSPPLKEFVFFFRCRSCGALYGRRASTPARCWIKEYGFLWTQKLTELWNNPKLSIQKIARALGRCCHAIVSQSIKLGLPNPRQGKKRKRQPASLNICSKPKIRNWLRK